MKDPYNPTDDPSEAIRSDLWPRMNITELTNQQDLVMSRLSLMVSMMGGNAPQSHRDMYATLQVALDDLNSLMDERMNNKNQEG